MIKKILVLLLMLFSVSAYPFDLFKELTMGPIVVPVYDQQRKLVSIRGTMLMNTPYEYIWDVVRDISSYKEYYPHMIKSSVKKIENNGNTIIADFEIFVPIFSNTVYSNKYVIDEAKGIIDVFQHSGQLEGSRYHWQFQKKDKNSTWVSYNGITKNYNSIIEKLEDKDQSIALTFNLTTIVTTLRQVDERARQLKNKKNSK